MATVSLPSASDDLPGSSRVSTRASPAPLVERTTRHIVSVHVLHGRNAAHFRDRLITVFPTRR